MERIVSDLMVVDAVEWRFAFIVNVDLVWLHRASDTHHTQIVLELKPAFTTPDEVHVGWYKVGYKEFTDWQLQPTTVATQQRVKYLLLWTVGLGAAANHPRVHVVCGRPVRRDNH